MPLASVDLTVMVQGAAFTLPASDVVAVSDAAHVTRVEAPRPDLAGLLLHEGRIIPTLSHRSLPARPGLPVVVVRDGDTEAAVIVEHIDVTGETHPRLDWRTILEAGWND